MQLLAVSIAVLVIIVCFMGRVTCFMSILISYKLQEYEAIYMIVVCPFMDFI